MFICGNNVKNFISFWKTKIIFSWEDNYYIFNWRNKPQNFFCLRKQLNVFFCLSKHLHINFNLLIQSQRFYLLSRREKGGQLGVFLALIVSLLYYLTIIINSLQKLRNIFQNPVIFNYLTFQRNYFNKFHSF